MCSVCECVCVCMVQVSYGMMRVCVLCSMSDDMMSMVMHV